MILGVIQEQHPERCQLFAQWQQFDWTILHDPINQLRNRAVPIVVAIDEAGRVVDTGLAASEYKNFLDREPAILQPKDTAASGAPGPSSPTSAAAWERAADKKVLWSGPEQLGAAIDEYRRAIELDPQRASAYFGLGVAYRMRYDSPLSMPTDFQAAVQAWGQALELDPNHYIYRRRIQQYGPRLDKPYPFYDWVEQAELEVRERGETPVALAVRPSGAEIAQPSRTVESANAGLTEPDPRDRINQDAAGFIDISAVVVPGKIEPGEAGRVHLRLAPADQAHWNNEFEPLKVWMDSPAGWTIEKQLWEPKQPPVVESNETRSFEFEFRTPTGLSQEAENPVRLTGYALYSICEEIGGQCLYLRQDFEIPIHLVR